MAETTETCPTCGSPIIARGIDWVEPVASAEVKRLRRVLKGVLGFVEAHDDGAIGTLQLKNGLTKWIHDAVKEADNAK